MLFFLNKNNQTEVKREKITLFELFYSCNNDNILLSEKYILICYKNLDKSFT